MNKFERMQTFVLVAESHSFADVARKTNVTTAAVSKQILMLETHLGLQLLNRSTRSHSVSLTEAGKIYYENCKRILADVLECEDIISHMKSEPSGTLRVFSSSEFGQHFLIPNLQEFLELYPKVSLQLELVDSYPDFSREDVDIFTGVSLAAPPDLASIDLLDCRNLTCAAPSYLEQHGTPKAPKDLAQHILINHVRRDNIFYFKKGMNLQLPTRIELNNTLSMMSAGKQGLGIMQLVDFTVNKALQSGDLQEVLSQYNEPMRRLKLYYRNSRFIQPKIRSFVDFICEKVAKQ